MTLFRPVSPKKRTPAEIRAFQYGLLCGSTRFFVDHPVLGHKNPLLLILAALCCQVWFRITVSVFPHALKAAVKENYSCRRLMEKLNLPVSVTLFCHYLFLIKLSFCQKKILSDILI